MDTHTHTTKLSASPPLIQYPESASKPHSLFCLKSVHVASNFLLLAAVLHIFVISGIILNPVNCCCLCRKARKQLPWLLYPISVPDHTKQLV